MTTITINNLNFNNQGTGSETRANLQPIENPISSESAAIVPVVSIYDIYGLEEGFSNNLSYADKVTLSPVGKMLSNAQSIAEATRETWVDPSKLLEGKAEFEEAFKEVQSEDGGIVFRRFNEAYLGQLQNVPDALLLYEQIGKADKDQIVVTSTQDLNAIVFKLRTMAGNERYNAIENALYKTSDLFDAKTKFTKFLTTENPALKDVDFEFSLKGDEIIIFGGKVNGIGISLKKMAEIETLANGINGKELKKIMLSIRETAVDSFNKYTEAGRKSPLNLNDFDQRFGDFGNYLESFKSSGKNHKYSGPDDPATYRESYFSNAADLIAARLLT